MSQYTPQALLVLLLWIPIVVYFFIRFPPQRAVVVSFMVGWMFLPLVTFMLPPLPNLTKMAATCYGILLATFIFDSERFGLFNPGWLDVPMLIWCLCPIASQFTNGGSPISPTFNQIVTWGIPYFLGRLYFSNLEGLRQLAVGIFAAGITYIPFCVFENAKGPVLHAWIYGFQVFLDWNQAKRYGGWRPVVFMEHGLMVGVWMMAAALVGLWLWQAGVLKKVWGYPVKVMAIVLTISFILCLSTGAYVYMVLGLAILFVGKWLRTALPLFLLIAALSGYLYMGASGIFSGDQIIAGLSQVLPEDRVASLEFRFMNEEVLGVRARQRMLFGWGDSGGNRIKDETGKDLAVTDSLWILAFGVNGVVGLASLMASLLLPAASFAMRFPASTWATRRVAPAAVLAILLPLYVLDSVLNAMLNPVFAVIAGGVAGVAMSDETATSPVKQVRTSAPQRSLNRQRQS